jgi:hypothetical protein
MRIVRNILLIALISCFLLTSCGAMVWQKTVTCATSDPFKFHSTTDTTSDHPRLWNAQLRHMVMTKVVPVFPLAALNPRAEHNLTQKTAVRFATPPTFISALRLCSLSDRAPPLS